MSMIRSFRLIKPFQRTVAYINQTQLMSSDSGQPGWGDGAGKGGGSGGTVRDAGGAFGKRQAAKEEEYFRQQNKSKLDALKESLKDEIEYHKDKIEDHEETIERHKRKLEELKKISEIKD